MIATILFAAALVLLAGTAFCMFYGVITAIWRNLDVEVRVEPWIVTAVVMLSAAVAHHMGY